MTTRWHGSDFVHSARNIRLDASMLCAELQSNEGEWVAGTIDLNTCIANVEGKLAHGKYSEIIEMLRLGF